MATRSVTLTAVSRPAHTRISAVERRAQIIAATRKVALARGLHDLRVADVAAELDVSTGLIHYHFATKHELLGAMLRDTAAEELNAVMLAIETLEHPTAQLEYMIDAYLPSPRRDQSWALWIDVWGEALRDPEIRRISEELDDGWVDVFAQVIAAGVESGRVPVRRFGRGRVAAVFAARRAGIAGRAALADDESSADERPRASSGRARARLSARRQRSRLNTATPREGFRSRPRWPSPHRRAHRRNGRSRRR